MKAAILLARQTIPAHLQLTDAILATLDARPSASGVTQRVEHCPEAQQADLMRTPARYELSFSCSLSRLCNPLREKRKRAKLERVRSRRMVNGKWEIVNGRPLVRAKHE